MWVHSEEKVGRDAGETYVDAILMSADGSSGLNPIGFCDDVLRRTPGSWRITHRTFTGVAFRVLP